MRYCVLVPKEVIEYFVTNFRSNPIGTCPFCFKRWDQNVKLVIRKNPTYFEFDSKGERLPYLELVAIKFILDIQSKFVLFLYGKLDFINSLDSSYKCELLTPIDELKPKYEEQ